jgi:hypothetical protein
MRKPRVAFGFERIGNHWREYTLLVFEDVRQPSKRPRSHDQADRHLDSDMEDGLCVKSKVYVDDDVPWKYQRQNRGLLLYSLWKK